MASTMESFQVNVDNPQQEQLGPWLIPGTISKKRRLASLLGSALVGTFLIGITCGYLASHGHFDNSMGGKACPGGSEITPSILHEFEIGLDTVTEWFPESAAMVLEHKKDIINHMVGMTDPAPDSKLRDLELVPHSDAEGIRRLAADTSAMATVPADPCKEAVANFTHSVMQFVVGFVRLKLELKYAFRVALLAKLQKLSQRDFNRIFEYAADFVTGNGTKKKVKAIWKLMKTSMKDLGKFLTAWVAAHADDPWDGIKKAVRMVSQFAVWFMKDTPFAFTSAVALQLASGQDMFVSGKKAAHVCGRQNRTRAAMSGARAALM